MSTTIDKAVKAANSNAGYNYNRQTLEDICNAGYDAIPDGVTLTVVGDQTLKMINNAIVCIKDGAATKTTPVTTDAIRELVVIMYAVTASKIGYKVGV